MNALVPKYANMMGLSASVVGLIGSLFALSALAMRPISGSAIDFLNKKYLLTVSNVVKAAAFIVYSQASNVGILVTARLIHGVGLGFSAPLLLAMANECLPEGRKASGIGFYSLAQVLAMSVGPAAGLYLSESIGYSATFLAGSGVMGLACILAATLPNNYDKSLGKNFRVGFSNIIAKEALMPATVMFLMALTYSSISFFMAIYGAQRGVTDIPLYFTAYAIALFFTRPASGILNDRFGAKMAIIPGHIIYCAAFFLISISKSLPMFILAGVVMAFGYGALHPAITHMSVNSVPSQRAGAAANTLFTFMDFGYLFGGLFAGFIHDRVAEVLHNSLSAYEVMYRIMIIPVAISLGIYLFNSRSSRDGRNGHRYEKKP